MRALRRYQAKLVRAKANLAEAKRQQAALHKLEQEKNKGERRIEDLEGDLNRLRQDKVRRHWLVCAFQKL